MLDLFRDVVIYIQFNAISEPYWTYFERSSLDTWSRMMHGFF